MFQNRARSFARPAFLFLQLFTIIAFVVVPDAKAAGQKSETSIDSNSSDRRYVLDPVELTPVTGFTVVDGNAGFNIGAHAAYPLLSSAPLYAEPSLIVGIFSGTTMFNLSAGARYDIGIADTRVRPFARLALGPTFKTSGSTAVFNAFAGGGALIPLNSNLELRAEAGLVNIDGNAGFELLGGISL